MIFYFRMIVDNGAWFFFSGPATRTVAGESCSAANSLNTAAALIFMDGDVAVRPQRPAQGI